MKIHERDNLLGELQAKGAPVEGIILGANTSGDARFPIVHFRFDGGNPLIATANILERLTEAGVMDCSPQELRAIGGPVLAFAGIFPPYEAPNGMRYAGIVLQDTRDLAPAPEAE